MDFYLSLAEPDWTRDVDATLLKALVTGDVSLDNLAPADVDATIAAMRARV
jgi:hypothetical protein